MAHTEKEKQTKNMNRCIELYSKIVNFCSHISYPSTAFQETFVGHLRSSEGLLGGGLEVEGQGGETVGDVLEVFQSGARKRVEGRVFSVAKW